jgi:MerR family copper efflux transcriptional regulator
VNNLLKIGELKEKSGVSIKTIRYYEEIGLIQPETRTSGNFRLFSPQALNRLRFIKRSQRLGLSLQEIGELLQIHDSGQLPCHEVRRKFTGKIAEIERQIADLQILKQELATLMAVSNTENDRTDEDIICPIIEQP